MAISYLSHGFKLQVTGSPIVDGFTRPSRSIPLPLVEEVRTPLDRIEGAYDLRLPTPVRWLFLNFNYNLTHHRLPRAAWQELHGHVDPAQTQPLWRRWLSVFRPPEPYPDDPSRLVKTYF